MCRDMTSLDVCQYVLSVAVFLSTSLASQNQWNFLPHREVEHAADVALTLITSSSMMDRTRREAGDTSSLFPNNLAFTFTVGSAHITLTLQKNQLLHTSLPTFCLRQGKIVPDIYNDQTDIAFYQDRKIGAAVLARRRSVEGSYHLTGSYFHEGQEFSIQPITDKETGGLDHSISRVFGQKNRQYDFMNFGADGSEKVPEIIAPIDGSWNVDNNNRDVTYKNQETGAAVVASHVADGGNHVSGMSDDGETVKSRSRKKRQAETYVLELAMVIDYGVYQVWYDGVADVNEETRRREALTRIKQFYSFILNGIDLRYSSVQRLANLNIHVTWAGIVIFDNPVEDYWTNLEDYPRAPRDRVESSMALETFRTWAGSVKAQLPPSDHVMLFTGHNLTYGGSVSNAGLAYLGSACNPDYFFSIVEEYFDFRDVAISAHELGHSLGARHDMDGNVCLAQDRYIMTSRFQFPNVRKASNPWLFSPCSVQYFIDFIQELDRNDTNCLIVQETTREEESILPLPGEVYAGDDLCRLGDGLRSYICREQHLADYTNICFGGVSCYNQAARACGLRLPPDGFSCGNRKWCLNGTCQLSSSAPTTQGDDCPYGDAPEAMAGQTCAERVLTARSDCYRDTFRARCCASCLRHRTDLPGCEYGDQFDLCVKDQCVNYDLEYARDNCCHTCQELLFTVPVPTPTTSSRHSSKTQYLRTRASDWSVGWTTRASDWSVGWRNHVTPPGGGRRVEQEKRARMREKTEQDGRRSVFRRRHNLHSEESEDSDDDMSRDYPKDNKRHSSGEETRTQGSLGMIRNFLDDIRNSRDSIRSQRMRLLVYFLNRIRRENLREYIPEH